MRTVGLKILKNKLSEYVRLAAAGETVVITDRGRPVAEIVPPHPHIPAGDGRPLSAFELRGLREGWLRPATIRDGSPPAAKADTRIHFGATAR
jgi:prevent-host-death family protein